MNIRPLDKEFEDEIKELAPRSGGTVAGIASQIFYGSAYKSVLDRRKKMIQRDRLIDRTVLIGWVVAMLAIAMVMAWMYHGTLSRATKDDAFIRSQQQTIEAQQTIIDVQKGLIGGLVLENNDRVLEADSYRDKWLEAIE